MEKPDRKKGFDPAKRKARDNARLRKIAANSSDKGARKSAPLIKAQANRRIRRGDRQKLAAAGAQTQETADARSLSLKMRQNHWGTENAADRRAERDAERAYLDETAGSGPRGRRRAQSFRMDRFLDRT